MLGTWTKQALSEAYEANQQSISRSSDSVRRPIGADDQIFFYGNRKADNYLKAGAFVYKEII